MDEMLTTLDTGQIMKALPHRFPFLMVDRIEEIKRNTYVKGYKNISINEPWAQGHFPEQPIFPGVMVIETMTQIGGFAFYDESSQTNHLKGYLVKVDKVKLVKKVVPGDCMKVTGDVIIKVDRMAQVKCTATVNGKMVALGVLTYAFE